MNFRPILLGLLLGCLWPWAATSTSVAAEPVVPPQRYLFVVDQSFSMHRFRKEVEQTVYDLISTGLQGKMRPGDTYGLWTYQEDLNTDYAMQVWRLETARDQAAAAGTIIRQRSFAKKERFDRVVANLESIIRAVPEVTVVLINDGEEPIKNLTFASEISAGFTKNFKEMQRTRHPFVTVLVAREGQIVDWSQNSPEKMLVAPAAWYNLPKPAPPVVAKTVVTNAPVAAAAPPKPAIVRPPLIITRESVAAVQPEKLSTPTPPPVAIAAAVTTNPPSAVLAVVAPPIPPANNPPAPIVPAVVAQVAVPVAAQAVAAPVPAPPAVPLSTPPVVQTASPAVQAALSADPGATPSPSTDPVAPVVVASVATPAAQWPWWLAIGLGGMGLIIAGILLCAAPTTSRSLISESMKNAR